MSDYPRNMIGYGGVLPKVEWPNKARIALQIVLNYEEGGENNILHGDEASESFLSEIVGALPIKGARHINMESIYEYGSRRGFWRLYEVFAKKMKIPITIFGVAMALKRNTEICSAIKEADFEIASHGWRWIDYQFIDKKVEREHMKLAINTIKELAKDKNKFKEIGIKNRINLKSDYLWRNIASRYIENFNFSNKTKI